MIAHFGAELSEDRGAAAAMRRFLTEAGSSRGEEPDKPFSGTFTVRMSPEMHRHVALEARRKGKSLNAYVVGRLKPSKAMPGLNESEG